MHTRHAAAESLYYETMDLQMCSQNMTLMQNRVFSKNKLVTQYTSKYVTVHLRNKPLRIRLESKLLGPDIHLPQPHQRYLHVPQLQGSDLPQHPHQLCHLPEAQPPLPNLSSPQALPASQVQLMVRCNWHQNRSFNRVVKLV